MTISITRDELRASMAAGHPPAILDVRTPAEFNRGHVPGAVNIPFQQIGKRIADVPARPNEELVVYCGHGPRAWIAAHALRARGFRRIVYLKGHWAGWRTSG